MLFRIFGQVSDILGNDSMYFKAAQYRSDTYSSRHPFPFSLVPGGLTSVDGLLRGQEHNITKHSFCSKPSLQLQIMRDKMSARHRSRDVREVENRADPSLPTKPRFSVDFDGETIRPSASIKWVGVWIDARHEMSCSHRSANVSYTRFHELGAEKSSKTHRSIILST